MLSANIRSLSEPKLHVTNHAEIEFKLIKVVSCHDLPFGLPHTIACYRPILGVFPNQNYLTQLLSSGTAISAKN